MAELNERMLDFIKEHHSAIVVTVRKDGSSHTARVTAGVVDGKVWISGTQTRVRTKHVRANPQGSLAVFADDGRWLGIEARIKIIEDPDVPQKLLALQRSSGREPEDVDAFVQTMVEQQRLIFEFEPTRVYGRYE
jgi:PPOX class probable F420-dependent enzyme